jgi:hypothetical protein
MPLSMVKVGGKRQPEADLRRVYLPVVLAPAN